MSSTDNIIILKSSDGESFEVKEAVARRSPTISHLIDGGIHLQDVTGKILSKVIEYCEMHVVDGDDLKAWDAEFVKVDQATLFALTKAAQYLDIKGLLNLSCQTAADQIKSLPPEELRKLFSIRNTFEPEEEEEVRRETRWNFE